MRAGKYLSIALIFCRHKPIEIKEKLLIKGTLDLMATILTRLCNVCNQPGHIEVTEYELNDYRTGLRPLRQILPNITNIEEQQLITGIHPECAKPSSCITT